MDRFNVSIQVNPEEIVTCGGTPTERLTNGTAVVFRLLGDSGFPTELRVDIPRTVPPVADPMSPQTCLPLKKKQVATGRRFRLPQPGSQHFGIFMRRYPL